MRPAATIAALCIACQLAPSASFAQAPSPSNSDGSLWRTISRGDSAEDVANKLTAMSEVKSAKVKGGADASTKFMVKVSYRDGGIPILGETFVVLPEFAGGKVVRLGLGSRPSCIDDLDDRYESFIAALKIKYPEMLTPKLTEADFGRAAYSATQDKPIRLTTVMANDQTVVLFIQEITSTDKPPVVAFGANRTQRALEGFAWNSYNRTASECNGTGANRAALRIVYMTKPDFSEAAKNAANQLKTETKQASDKM